MRTSEETKKEFEKRMKNKFLNMIYELNSDNQTRNELRKVPVRVLEEIFILGGQIGISVYGKLLMEEKEKC